MGPSPLHKRMLPLSGSALFSASPHSVLLAVERVTETFHFCAEISTITNSQHFN